MENSVQTLIYDKLQNEGLVALLLNETTCGSTICRLMLEVDETKVDADNQIAMDDISQIWSGAGFFAMDDRSGELTLYIARKGYVLSDMLDI